MTRHYELCDLLPGYHLQSGQELGSWLVTGQEPYFSIPCDMRKGWIQIRIAVRADEIDGMELFADDARGNVDVFYLGQAEGSRESVHYVYLARPARCILLAPQKHWGMLHIDRFRLRRVSSTFVFFRGALQKIRGILRSRHLSQSIRKAFRLAISGRWKTFSIKILSALSHGHWISANQEYLLWRKIHRITPADMQRMREKNQKHSDTPRISLVLESHGNSSEQDVRRTIESVLAQAYPHWELILAWPGTLEKKVQDALDQYENNEPRIRRVRFEKSLRDVLPDLTGIAGGQYLMMLDAGDALAPHALYSVAGAINSGESPDLVYSDEDRLESGGRRNRPFFKPDWSPEYLMGFNYLGRLAAFRMDRLNELGGLRGDYFPAHEYDLALRIFFNGGRAVHIPDVLYHRLRKPPNPVLSGKSSEQIRAERKSLEACVRRCSAGATVEPGRLSECHRVRYAIDDNPKVSILIPTACKESVLDGKRTCLVLHCIESIIERSRYQNREIIVVENKGIPDDVRRRLEQLGVRILSYREPFNFSSVCNLAARNASGEHLLLLNDDMEVLSEDWIEAMLEFSQRENIGAVGAHLRYPGGGIQHAGVTYLGGGPSHLWAGYPGNHPGYFNGNLVHRDVLAVTGACLMTRAKVYRSLGGFDEAFPMNYNDVDYCLKVLTAGMRVVLTPYARLTHHESATRKAGVLPKELDGFVKKWSSRWPRDPYYNPNLSPDVCDYRINLASPETFNDPTLFIP
jgi:GT2 family glycosyltransferase